MSTQVSCGCAKLSLGKTIGVSLFVGLLAMTFLPCAPCLPVCHGEPQSVAKQSPLDKLDSEKIPTQKRFARQPKEIVAVLGTSRDPDLGIGVNCLHFSGDGKWLATGGMDRIVRLWDTGTLRQVAALKGHKNWISSVALSVDGQLLASGSDDGTVRVWTVIDAKPKPRAVLKHTGLFGGAPEKVTSVALSIDGKMLASGSENHTVKLWDLTGEKLKEWDTIPTHSDRITSVAFSPDSKTLATASWDESVRLW